MHLFVQSIIIGVLIGGVYALLASGMTMMFGVTRIINFAQAMFAIVCAYLSYSLFTHFGLDPFLSVAILMPMMFLFGYGVYSLLLRRLGKSGTGDGVDGAVRTGNWRAGSHRSRLRHESDHLYDRPMRMTPGWSSASRSQ